MEFVKFWEENKRMCETTDFLHCPFKSEINGCYRCKSFISDYPQKAERIVEQWAKEHPIVTNADKFKEVFGVPIGSYGAPCPSALTIYEIGIMSNNDWLKQEYRPPKRNDE